MSACHNPQAARRKAGNELQARMAEIDKQFTAGQITQAEKEAMELQAIEMHKLRWNKIGDVPVYGPQRTSRGSSAGYRPQAY